MTQLTRNQCLNLDTYTPPATPLLVTPSQHIQVDFQAFNARYLCGGGALVELKSVGWLDLWKRSVGVNTSPLAHKLAALIKQFNRCAGLLANEGPSLEHFLKAYNQLIGHSSLKKGIRNIESWRGEQVKEGDRIYFVEPTQISSLINELLVFIENNHSSNKDSDFSVHVITYTQFINIHPFTDANGRFSRALLESHLPRALSPNLYRLTDQGRKSYTRYQANQSSECHTVLTSDFWQEALSWQTRTQIEIDDMISHTQAVINNKLALRHLLPREKGIIQLLWQQPLISPFYVAQQLHCSPQQVMSALKTLHSLKLIQPFKLHGQQSTHPKTLLFLCKETSDLWLNIEKAIFDQ